MAPFIRFVSKTDENGVAIISGVPPEYNIGIAVSTRKYEMIVGNNGEADFKMSDQPITEVTLKVKKIE